MVLRWLLVAVAATLTGCGAGAFECQTDDQCDGGACEGTGYCSFPDDTCPSGRRYAKLAGGGLAGECVDDPGTGTEAPPTTMGTASASGTTSSSTSTTADNGVSTLPTDPLTAGDTGSPTTTGGQRDDSTTGGDCPGMSRCVERPAPMWVGPVHVQPAVAGECPEDARTLAETVYGGIVAAEPQCDCDCAPNPSMCDGVTLFEASDNCDPGKDIATLDAGDCLELNPPARVVVDWNLPADVCQATLDEDVAPVSWMSTSSLCAADRPVECDDGICIPAPGAMGATCVYRNGNHSCPAGPYSVEVTAYTGFSDSRGCTACSCNAGVTPLRCELTTHDSAECDDPFDTYSSSNTECFGELGGVDSIEVAQAGSCGIPLGGAPTGSASPEGTITLCCVP